ncbi:MAG: DegV family protein, partial [Chloroflexi bacterium HGW-Chloroflexi-8]
MANVVVLTDSTAYIPTEITNQLPISVIPLTLILDGKTYFDGEDIMPDEFYQLLLTSSSMPQTSQVTVSQYEKRFGQLIDEGYEILNLGISSGISSSYQSACQAQKSFPGKPIEIMDTKLVSMALGFQVLAAA